DRLDHRIAEDVRCLGIGAHELATLDQLELEQLALWSAGLKMARLIARMSSTFTRPSPFWSLHSQRSPRPFRSASDWSGPAQTRSRPMRRECRPRPGRAAARHAPAQLYTAPAAPRAGARTSDGGQTARRRLARRAAARAAATRAYLLGSGAESTANKPCDS